MRRDLLKRLALHVKTLHPTQFATPAPASSLSFAGRFLENPPRLVALDGRS